MVSVTGAGVSETDLSEVDEMVSVLVECSGSAIIKSGMVCCSICVECSVDDCSFPELLDSVEDGSLDGSGSLAGSGSLVGSGSLEGSGSLDFTALICSTSLLGFELVDDS